jgi:hypothetical protein
VDTGQLEGCFVRNFVQFAIGRATDDTDDGMVDALTERFEDDDDAVALLLEFVTSEGFRHRRLDGA